MHIYNIGTGAVKQGLAPQIGLVWEWAGSLLLLAAHNIHSVVNQPNPDSYLPVLVKATVFLVQVGFHFGSVPAYMIIGIDPTQVA